MQNLDWSTISVTAGLCLVAVIVGNLITDKVVEPTLFKTNRPGKPAGK